MKDMKVMHSDAYKLIDNILGTNYRAQMDIFHGLRKGLREVYTHSATMGGQFNRFSVYQSYQLNNRSKWTLINRNYDGTFTVEVWKDIIIDHESYSNTIYKRTFYTLKDAVKARQEHYKDN